MEINESDRFAWFARGKILANAGLWQQAANCFDKAIAIEPQFYEAWSEKGDSLEKLGKFEEADFCFNQSLGAFCNDLSQTLENDLEVLATPEDLSAGGVYNQACFHAILGNVELAINYLTSAIELDPIRYKTLAAKDNDFSSIWQNDEFQELTTFSNVSCA